jgi:uncharacterized protein involved in exopolysaccharide biosynthesis
MADKLSSTHRVAVDTLEDGGLYNELAEKNAAREKGLTRLRLLWNQRQFIFRVAAVGLLLSTLLAFLIPARYEAVARLMPPDQGGGSMAALAMAATTGGKSGSDVGSLLGSGLGSSLGEMAGNLLGLKSTGALFVGVIQSESVEDDLITKFNLQKLYWDRHIEDARTDLEARTDVNEDRKSGIIILKVTDRSPTRAADMAREYVEQLNRVLALVSTSSAHRERIFLEGRLSQVKQDLESAENNFSNFASKNTALDVPAQGKAMIEAAATLDGELIAARTELQGLQQIYADGNVRVRATRARVQELQQQLDKLGGKYDPAAGQAALDDSMYPSIRQLPQLGVGYADFYRNAKIQEAIFDTLTQEYELAKVQEAKETPTVKVLDEARIPDKRSFPPRMLIMLLGTVLAFVASVTWLFGHALWERTEPTDARKLFAQEVFGVVRARVSRAPQNGVSGNGSAGAHGQSGSTSDHSER